MNPKNEMRVLRTMAVFWIALCCACSSGESSSGQETGSAGQAGSAGQNAGGDAGSAGTAGSDGCAIHSDCPPGTLCDDTANECRIGCRVVMTAVRRSVRRMGSVPKPLPYG